MKLSWKILLHLSWVLAVLLGAWSVLFYVTLTDEINDETDDMLENRAEAIVKRVLATGEFPDGVEGAGEWLLVEVPEAYAVAHAHERYSDEERYIPERDDEVPARVLRQLFRDREGRWYELTVMTPTIEKEDLQEAILSWCVWLYLLLLLSVLLVTVWLLYRMMRPLYALLRWLDAYRVGGENPALETTTSVVEFRRLNEAVGRFVDRAEASFERQKQFIGNASHEMQTPLAVCRNRLEMLVDDARTLTPEQLAEIASVQRTLGRLVRLNRTLLLLTKIDNGQFPESSEVDVGAQVRTTAEELGDIYAYRGVTLRLAEETTLIVRMNPSLAESLVANLLKNAFVHGDANGTVDVRVAGRSLEVTNDGAAGPLDGARIFDRFYRATEKEGSSGLGLALVEAVCRLYGLRVSYDYVAGRHRFTVQFPPQA
ncbi:HAMP domain-containing sensor histidine kinase [uncultured Alistipes sp.]|uniref:sensor histidine kinase n=1 Tax=uncultured Alistipes sp. TaxID=538949 RepID=UPI00262D0AA6|nr:HAMP domain-containing sensor histidine kinase [uncultured Alistipes sp.]